jgi:accessory colonization factor AcfC
MRSNNKVNPGEEKRLARKKYAERQVDKWIKWSIEVKGKIRFKELLAIQKEYKLYEEHN